MKVVLVFFIALGCIPAGLSRSSGAVDVDQAVEDARAFLQNPGKKTEQTMLRHANLHAGKTPPCPKRTEKVVGASKYKELIDQLPDGHVKQVLLKVIGDGEFTPSECKDVEEALVVNPSPSESDSADSSTSNDPSAESFLGYGLRLTQGRKANRGFEETYFHEILDWAISRVTNSQICLEAQKKCEASKRRVRGTAKTGEHLSCVLECHTTGDQLEGNKVFHTSTGINCQVKGISRDYPKYKNTSPGDRPRCAETGAWENARDAGDGTFNVLYTRFSPCARCSGTDPTDKKRNHHSIRLADEYSRQHSNSDDPGLWLICAGRPYKWRSDWDTVADRLSITPVAMWQMRRG